MLTTCQALGKHHHVPRSGQTHGDLGLSFLPEQGLGPLDLEQLSDPGGGTLDL